MMPLNNFLTEFFIVLIISRSKESVPRLKILFITYKKGDSNKFKDVIFQGKTIPEFMISSINSCEYEFL
jgi:hypothetical protein